MRLVFAILSLLLGATFPLLLNGQPFSNSLIGITLACAAATLALSAKPEARTSSTERYLRASLAGLAVLLAAVLLVQLPSAYREQRSFNRRSELLREARGHATSREELKEALTAAATKPAEADE